MIWGAITLEGVGRLYRVNSNLNAQGYISSLEEALLPTISLLNIPLSYIKYQHGGAKCHTAKITEAWLKTNNIETLPWMPHSPDLNIIENLWATLKCCICEHQLVPRNVEELWEVAETEWYAIPDQTVKELYAS